MPKASIVVPLYNAARYLPRTLPSLLSQEGVEDYEVILVDNNSTDDALSTLSAHPRLRILTEPVQGAYVARNRGVEAAIGEILVFTDPDCLAEPTWLRELLARIEEPGVEVVMGRDRAAGQGRSIRLLSAYDHVKEAWTLDQERAVFYYGHTNNMAVSRRAWELAGPFDPRPRGADTILVQRVTGKLGTGAVVYHPAALVHHLEVGTARDYFRKCELYGESQSRYRTLVDARALGWRERWMVYGKTVRERRLGPLAAGWLLALLVVGVTCFWWGQRRGAARP